MNEEIQDTSGFYRIDDNNYLHYGQNLVSGDNFSLNRLEKDTYTYPIQGWRWFDSVQLARSYYNVDSSQ